MSSSISFTVRPPPAGGSGASGSDYRPSPLGNSSRPAARVGPPSRRHFESGHDDSDDDDDDFGRRPSGSGSNRDRDRDRDRDGRREKASKAQPEAPLVIPSLPNRDWRDSARRVPTYRPPERDMSETVDTKDRIGDEPARSGLRKVVKAEDFRDDAAEPTAQSQPVSNGASSKAEVEEEDDGEERKPLTLEEQALRAILAGDPKTESSEERAQRDLILSSAANRTFGGMTEDDAFKRDIANLPNSSTMDDFEAVPISAFGMAALRGMGYNPETSDRPKAREVVRRPQLLGLGATPMDTAIMPTHGKKTGEKPKEKKKTHAERTGRGFNASSLLVATPRSGAGSITNGGASGASTPRLESGGSGSRRTSPGGSESDASRRRRRDEDERDYDSGRESKRRDRDGDSDRERARDRDRDRDRYGDRETEEERARRKARERERDRERYPNGDGPRDRYRDRERERKYDDRDRDREREKDRDRDRYRDRDDRDSDRHR